MCFGWNLGFGDLDGYSVCGPWPVRSGRETEYGEFDIGLGQRSFG